MFAIANPNANEVSKIASMKNAILSDRVLHFRA